MLKVGLTGSIAVGKSNVLRQFRELGCDVLDADQTARDVVRPGTDGIRQIEKQFGKSVIKPSGELDRAKLAETVFGDEEKRKALNAIVHPLVLAAQTEWMRDREIEHPDGIAIVDAALLIESGGYKRFDQLIVVFCEPAIQLKRLMLRDSLTEAEAKKRITAQMPQEEKKRYADHLIDTSGDFDVTRRQVIDIFDKLRDLNSKARDATDPRA
jgi:dephospho-CoA kinase